jgi:YidC/Oxa1 family membrane protein insertase
VNPFTLLEDAVGWLLSLFYAIPPHNLGIAIILMTCAVMALMLPLTAKQVRSMVAMQRLQPEIKRIQQQYKDDKQQQSQEIMKFYQENQINPLSGCLPLVVQLPVWIALYRTLRDMPHHVVRSTGAMGQLYRDLCGEAVSRSACAKSGGNAMNFLGMNLRESLFQAHKTGTGFFGLLPYGIMVALAVITGIVQVRQTMARQAKTGAAAQAPPQMQTMMKITPLFNLMTIVFPAGIGLYWVSRNVWTIGQQHFVLAKYYEEHPSVQKGGGGAKPSPSTKALPDVEVPPAASGNGNGASANGNGQSANGSAARQGRANPSTSKKKQQRRRR